MPDDIPLPPPDEPRAGRRAAKPPAERKPRAPRKKPTPVVEPLPAPALVVGLSPDEAVLAAGLVRQAAEELDAVRARRDQLLESLAAVETRLAELRDEARALEDLTAVRAALDTAAARVRDTSRDAEGVRRNADEAAETFREVGRLLGESRASVESVRAAVTEADATAREAEARARSATAEADRARRLLAGVREDWGAIDAAARRTLDELRAAVEVARDIPLSAPVPPPVPEVVVAPPRPDPLADVPAVPPDDRAADARDRLVRYLNEAGAVAREQGGLFQTLADAAGDADLRAVLEAHRETNRRQRAAIEERVRALGGEPESGRGLLGQLVTRIWDAVQKPLDSDDTVEVLIQALGAAEFAAGAYLSATAFARASGDGPTAELTADLHRQERALADRLRAALPATAGRAARRSGAGAGAAG